MTAKNAAQALTGSLEDYLETVFLLLRRGRVARVRDIAFERGVAPASVTPALRRLAEMGLVDYVKREYVRLTHEGQREALRVLARHQVLRRFFSEFLQMPPEAAEREACTMEHSLSDEGMDRLVRFVEFATMCPIGSREMLDRFHSCARVHVGEAECGRDCASARRAGLSHRRPSCPLSQVSPGLSAKVVHVNAAGPVRQRLLDMGLLPGVEVRVQRTALGGDPIWIEAQGAQMALREAEAAVVVVEPLPLEA
jgi:DtxR family Mn-dependent transcriptional regulator